MHLKILSAEVVCCKQLPNKTDELSIEANSVDPEQMAPIGAVLYGSTLFAIEASLTFQQATIAATGALRVNPGSSVVECFTRDREAAGSSLTGVTALWSLSKTHLS